MPSDPAGVHPQGVLARPAPDFFDDHLFCGGYTMQNAVHGFVNYIAISLFNNATSGVVFKVYGIECAGDVSSSVQVYSIYGTLGTFVQNCAPTRADLGQGYGQIYQATTVEPDTVHPNPYIFPPLLAVLGDGYPGQTHVWPFPRFIVPVGYSLIVVNSQSDDQIGASFVYQQANE